MSLGPYCKTLGIDEEVLSGEKTVTCTSEQFINGVAWELRKYKAQKKSTAKEIVNWIVKILDLKCEINEAFENELNENLEKVATMRATFSKSAKNFPGEVDRLMKWRFNFPASTGFETVTPFEPMERANLGPKLLKVLKEKGADVDDSMDLSGPSDDDDEQAKRRKAREEIIQLKKDLGTVRKSITGLNDKLNDLSKMCPRLSDVTKISVSESRRMENDLIKLKAEWSTVISSWHDCIERLNHVSVNKSNYLDVGYMVRRNKTKQGIFDELNFEFEKAIEEFKNKVSSLLSKERQKKKPVPREYKQKSKSDRKRVRHEEDDEKSDESKKICISEDSAKPEPAFMPVEEFLKSETVEEFKNGKFAASLKAIYIDLTTMPIPCKNVQDIFFSVLNSLEGLNVEKIPAQFFAGNIYMEVRMLAMIQAFSDFIKMSKINICNDVETKFNLIGYTYEVTLSNGSCLTLGVRDLTSGSRDTSFIVLKDLFNQVLATKFEASPTLNQVVHALKNSSFNLGLSDGKLTDIVFLYKQQVLPKLNTCLENCSSDNSAKLLSLNNFCTGIYFLIGLAQLVDVTILLWELVSQNVTPPQNTIFSQTVQNLYSFCETLESSEEHAEIGQEFNTYVAKEKKMENSPLAPFKDSLFNVIFHNSAGIWFYHEVGILADFFEGIKEKELKFSPGFAAFKDSKQSFAVIKALGLIGKLIAAPIWMMLEDYEADISERYAILLKKIEAWSKDADKFMKGQDYIFQDQQMSHDAVFISLIKDNEASDGVTKEILELLFTAFIPYIQSFVSVVAKSDNAKVNGGTDSDMKVSLCKDIRMFDCITKSVHSFSNFALDAMRSYSKARNGEWQDKLNTRANSQVAEIIQGNANKQLKSLYKRKIRLSELKEQMLEKREEFSRCQLIEKRYKLIDDLIRWGGLWKSEKEVDDRLKDMKDSDRMLALKSQIKFRRHVLGEVYENNLLDLAYDGEMFNYKKLYDNLKAVLKNECQVTETDNFELASATDDESLKLQIYESCKNAINIGDSVDHQNYAIKNNFYWLLGKKLQHSFVKTGNRENHSGVCVARKKINGVYFYFMGYKSGFYKFSESKIAEDYRNKNLQVVEPAPKDLVGMRLSRAFYKDDGYLEWYDCRVIASTGGPEYVVEFDYYGSDVTADVSDETPLPEIETLTFTCRVIDDYRTGQLRFL